MSIIINYPSNSNINRVALHLRDEKQAISIDLLATMFQILSEVSKRFEKKIADITLSLNVAARSVPGHLELHLLSSILDYTREPEQVLMRTALAEAWTLIDYVHRAGELLPLAQVMISTADEELLRRIKLMRNSYQHGSERIEEHFTRSGSVFGNLSWQVMDAQKTSIVTLYPSMSPTDASSGNFEDAVSEAATIEGISMVKLHFVAKETKKSPVVDYELSLDAIAAMMNDIISRMESTYQGIVDWANAQQQEHPESWIYVRVPPSIIWATRNNEDMHPHQ